MLTNFNLIPKIKVDGLRGGEGHVFVQKISPVDLPVNCKMCAMLTLQVNCSIGFHRHEGDAEIIYVMSGEATLTGDHGKEKITKGMINVTKNHECHAIKNEHSEDLILYAIIINES